MIQCAAWLEKVYRDYVQMSPLLLIEPCKCPLIVSMTTDHHKLSDVFEGTVAHAAVLDGVPHKAQGLPQHVAKHLRFST